MEENKKQHPIRFPPELYERIHREAKVADRSFNAQVIHLLKSYYQQQDEKHKKKGQ